MTKGFWAKLHKPIMVMAPMADVTDCAFREIIAKHGKPDVLWTEFVSSDGLCSPGRKILKRDLEYGDGERPIVAQLFTSHPEKMREAAQLVKELGFDGLDINMGCPDKSVEKQGAGAAHIKNPELAKEVIKAAQQGADGLPVSVKTRIGYNKDEIDTWIPALLSCNLPALTVHLRTRKEMSDVPAHWDYMKRIVALRDTLSPETLILGNGDVKDMQDGLDKLKESGADGIMFGRAIFGNPWLFKNLGQAKDAFLKNDALPVQNYVPDIKEKLTVMMVHTELYEKKLGDIKSFAIMKKHFKAYVNGFDGAKELRTKLMETNSAAEVRAITEQFLATL